LAYARTLTIIQDSQGFIWFGTDLGLARYNRYEIKMFNRDPNDFNSIKDHQVNALFLTSDGNILIGTNSYGLIEFDPRKEVFHHLNLIVNEERPSVTSIQEIIQEIHGLGL